MLPGRRVLCKIIVLHHRNGQNRCELTLMFSGKSNKTNKQKQKNKNKNKKTPDKQVKIKSTLFFSEAGRIYCQMIRS